MRIDAASAARIVSGTLVGNDAVADGIWFDTRVLAPGQAFVAIRAERDGHDHLGAARDAGAPFALVERGRSLPGLPCVEVDDTLAALAALGTHCRDRLQ
ncbi:MAG: UDP-N-acetylmuramoylalanyl-D-glutamyl-2, 6-diaminopimelate--D-alanyl-D-alanine ligase, partial [Actinomycetota bacterium]